MKNLLAGFAVLAAAGATFGAASYYVYKKLKDTDRKEYSDIILDEEKAYEDEVYEAAGLKKEAEEEKKEEKVEETEKEEAAETECEKEAEKETDTKEDSAQVRESIKAVADEAMKFAKTVAEAAEKKVTAYAGEEKMDEIKGAVSDFCDKATEFADTAFDKAEEVGSTVAERAVKLYTDVKEIIEGKKDEK